MVIIGIKCLRAYLLGNSYNNVLKYYVMKTETYPIYVEHRGVHYELPVEIRTDGDCRSISVLVDGMHIFFSRDEHDGLTPACHSELDPELLYCIGRAVQDQRPTIACDNF